MAQVSSEPRAYLRPLYRELARGPSFALISAETQFGVLVAAVARQSEMQAAHLREYTFPARMALLGHLAKMESQRPAPKQVTLWSAAKAQRRLECVALYVAHGIDVRLLEDGDVRRTQLVKDGPQAEQLAGEWQGAAVKLGWLAVS